MQRKNYQFTLVGAQSAFPVFFLLAGKFKLMAGRRDSCKGTGARLTDRRSEVCAPTKTLVKEASEEPGDAQSRAAVKIKLLIHEMLTDSIRESFYD